MTKFAFIIHPLDTSDVLRKFAWMKHLPEKMVEGLMCCLPPLYTSEITGVRSLTGEEVQGWFIACPLTTRQIVQYPEHYVLRKIIDACRKAEKLGAEIIGLGAFTSVVGDKGITISKALNVPVTTGNSYTVATAIEGILIAATEMGLDLNIEKISIIGATGSIGSACAKILAKDCKEMNLLARTKENLYELADELTAIHPNLKTNVFLSEEIRSCLADSRVIVSASGAVGQLVEPNMLRPGSVVCDVARPRDVAVKVARERKDILVIEGGVVKVPGPVEFNFNFGFPPKTSYACMAETMILALEKRLECFSLGSEMELVKIREIAELAKKHGFQLAGLRSFEQALTREALEEIRSRAREILLT